MAGDRGRDCASVSRHVRAGVSKVGRRRFSMRLMVSLLYLKHAFNESDEGVVENWAETPTSQNLSRLEYFEHCWPCELWLLGRYPQLLGEAGVDQLMARTINMAVNLRLIDVAQLRTLIVDPTVQEKAITYSTDSKMLETARSKLVEAAKAQGIELMQTYAKEGASLRFWASRYAHARQFKRMRRAIKRQRTIAGRLQREIERKAASLGLRRTLEQTLANARKVIGQTAYKKTSQPQYTQAVQLARPRGAVHQQGQEPQLLRVRGQGGHCADLSIHPDRGRTRLCEHPVRWQHTDRATQAGHDPDARHRRHSPHGLHRSGLSRRGSQHPSDRYPAPEQEENARRNRLEATKTTLSHRADHRESDHLSPSESVPSDGRERTSDLRGDINGALQHSVATAYDLSKEPARIFASASNNIIDTWTAHIELR